MRRFVQTGIVVVALLVSSTVRADCVPFTCWDDATDHTACEPVYCSPFGGCDPATYWALSCDAVCDRMGGETQCWCRPRGECMFI